MVPVTSPLQEYVYEPVPPAGLEYQVTDWLVRTGLGETEQVKVKRGLTVKLEGVQDLDWVPDVTATVAVFVPVVEYEVLTFWVVPVASPLQEYE